MNIKIPTLPDCLFNMLCTVSLNADGISEDGEPIQGSTINTRCIYQAKFARKMTKDGTYIETSGVVILNGDAFPCVNNISSGTIVISEQTYKIFSGLKALSPDGTVHHTEFTII